VGIASFNPYTLVARNDLPFNSLKEILDFARAHPGKLTYASAGNGTGQHITAAVTFHLAGVQVTHVPYKGAAPAYQDLLPGRVDLFFDNSATAQPHIEARRVADRGVERGAPRLAAGRTDGARQRPDFDNETWIGYFVRAGTPARSSRGCARISTRCSRCRRSPRAWRSAGTARRTCRARTQKPWSLRDIDKWTQLIRSAGIRAAD
jgi:tripartite-type tricarboxylate transporter receptor subunit TctC